MGNTLGLAQSWNGVGGGRGVRRVTGRCCLQSLRCRTSPVPAGGDMTIAQLLALSLPDKVVGVRDQVGSDLVESRLSQSWPTPALTSARAEAILRCASAGGAKAEIWRCRGSRKWQYLGSLVASSSSWRTRFCQFMHLPAHLLLVTPDWATSIHCHPGPSALLEALQGAATRTQQLANKVELKHIIDTVTFFSNHLWMLCHRHLHFHGHPDRLLTKYIKKLLLPLLHPPGLLPPFLLPGVRDAPPLLRHAHLSRCHLTCEKSPLHSLSVWLQVKIVHIYSGDEEK